MTKQIEGIPIYFGNPPKGEMQPVKFDKYGNIIPNKK